MEDLFGRQGDTHEIVLALQAIIAATLARLEFDNPGNLGSIIKTAQGILDDGLSQDPAGRDMATAHVDRLAAQAARMVHRARG